MPSFLLLAALSLGSLLGSASSFLAAHVPEFVLSAVVSFVGGTFLKRVISTKQRAEWLEKGCHAAYVALIDKAQATPNGFDDLALAFVKQLEAWAHQQGEVLSATDRLQAKSFVTQKLALDPVVRRMGLDASLAPVRALGIDVSGMDVPNKK